MNQDALQGIRIIQIASLPIDGEWLLHGLDSIGRLWRFESGEGRWVMLCGFELAEDREPAAPRRPLAGALVDVAVEEC